MQTDMFMSEDVASLALKIEKVQSSTEKVRRGLFARNTQIEKYLTEIRDQIQSQENEIYKLKQAVHTPRNVISIEDIAKEG